MIATRLDSFGVCLEFSPSIDPLSLNFDMMRTVIQEEKLVVIRGLQAPSRETLLQFSMQLHGQKASKEDSLLFWSFGPVMEMKETPDSPNYLFSSEEVPYHWDGAFHEEPLYLLFHCIEAPQQNTGGETFFCNTEKLLADSTVQELESYEKISLTYRTEKKAHYGGSITRALLTKHPVSNAPILRYAEPVHTEKNPVQVEMHLPDTVKQKPFSAHIQKKIYAKEYMYTHTWKNGDLLLVDNFSCLHGRNTFSTSSPRHLRRIQIKAPNQATGSLS